MTATRLAGFRSVSGKAWVYATLAGAVVGLVVWQCIEVEMHPDDNYQESSTSSAAAGRQVGTGGRWPSEHWREYWPAQATTSAVALSPNAAPQDLTEAISAVQVEAKIRQRPSSGVQAFTASSDMAPVLDAPPQDLSDAISLVQNAADGQQPAFPAVKSPAPTAQAAPLDEAVTRAQFVSFRQQLEISVAYPFSKQ